MIKSPCKKICKLVKRKGNGEEFCIGCGRTREEIKLWSKSDNNYTTPLFLYKAGTVAMRLSKFKKAEEYFTSIKLDYPKSPEAKNIDAFISKAIASNQ